MDESTWTNRRNPAMWIVTLPEAYSAEEFSGEFDRLTEHLRALQRRTTILIDVTKLSSSDPRNRSRAARFFREERALLERWIAGWAFVVPKATLRGAITAIGWLADFPIPTRTFERLAPAEAWLASQLTARVPRDRP